LSEEISEYIERVEEACGKGGDFIAIIKHEKAQIFLEKAARSGEVSYTVPGVMVRTKIRQREVSVTRTGRVLIKGIGNPDEAKSILNEIIRN